jgi:hypothetical protein
LMLNNVGMVVPNTELGTERVAVRPKSGAF